MEETKIISEIKPQKKLRIVCISDTHNNHRLLKTIPDGDILIHAGDFTKFSDIAHASDFNE